MEEGRRLARQLLEQGAEMVVALTHMRAPNDVKLAESVPEINLVLGGHDHGRLEQWVGPQRTLVLKSGTDFREVGAPPCKGTGPKLRARVDGFRSRASS